MAREDTTTAVIRGWMDLMWSQQAWDRIPEFVAPTYVRHEPSGTRTVTPEEYGAELSERVGDIGVPKYEVFADGDLGIVIWTGSRGQASSVQAYRVQDARLAETWYSAIVPVGWPISPSETDLDRASGRALLDRWYEMYATRKYSELAPQLCGPVFTRHESTGTFDATAEEHAERLTKAAAAAGGPPAASEYRAVAGGDKVGVIGIIPEQHRAWVQAWRIADGKLVESWWPGFANDVDWTLPAK